MTPEEVKNLKHGDEVTWQGRQCVFTTRFTDGEIELQEIEYHWISPRRFDELEAGWT